MNILILNWRDIKNPTGGGAEQLTHEMARRWVQNGHAVTQISSLFPQGKRKETIDGVKFVRMGKWWTVHVLAGFYYRRYLSKKTDIIIDEVHWFPFFSKVYASKKTIALTCEVANKLLFTIFPFPIAGLFRIIEKFYLKLYKDVPTMVISESTKSDLIAHGHTKRDVIVLPMGFTKPTNLKQYKKEKTPTIIYLARLNKQKGIFDAVESVGFIKEQIQDIRLWVLGMGDKTVLDDLKKQIEQKDIYNNVTFFGFVSEDDKYRLLAKSHILIVPSAQEGWGLTVPEAGLVKTPTVAYNVLGLRDIIEDGISGKLVATHSKALAKGVIDLLQNKKQYQLLQMGAMKRAHSFDWDKTGEVSLSFMKKYL